MAMIELNDRGVTGRLVDGYLPDFTYFQNINWAEAKMNYLSENPDHQYRFKTNCQKYLKPAKNPPSIRVQSNIHKHLIKSLADRSCESETIPCVQINFPAQADRKYDRRVVLNRKIYRDNEVLPFCEKIEAEILKDQCAGKNYFFNVSLLDSRQNKACPEMDYCFGRWSEFMDFKMKKEEDYLDFLAFKDASNELLKSYIELAHYFGWFNFNG